MSDLAALARSAEQTRRRIEHLDELAALGPCPPPLMVDASDWCRPEWHDRWMRAHPELIRLERQALVDLLARLNESMTRKARP